MKRRQFLTRAGLGAAAATTIAAPAIAQSMPELKWRLASSFPKSLDTLFGGSDHMAKRVAEATDNKFQIRTFAAGEIVPPFQVLDAVQNGTVEMAHTAAYYFIGKDITFALDCTVPFGMNTRQQNAWWTHGGGAELLREFYKDYNVYNIPTGNTGAQMGGWFRKEIKTVADLKGLKFRIGGFAGQVLDKLGVIPQQIPGGDIYPSLEKGTIDAAEWVGPYDDEKLGFYKVAKFYYYPGWWEGGTQISSYVGLDKWNTLPKAYQTILETACAEANTWMIGKYDAQNPDALKRLLAGGAQLRAFPAEIMDACYKAAQTVFAETSAKNAKFKKVYDSYKKFLDEEYEWFQVAESTYDNFMVRATRAARNKKA
ncbi:MAG: TRAP transporter substrate-binding protein [Proteobacteria bacterium]|nr:TRAP transporter substrate-binding protein [Pseudomonadota bacterium]